jgi:hypothetical protein
MFDWLSPITKIAGTYLDGRQKKAEAKIGLEVAKIEAKAEAARAGEAWDEKALGGAVDSFKDEAWTICFIGIILASFVPAAQPYMKSGFEFLKTAPDFIQWGILASIGASFGIKSIGQFRK